MIEIKCTQENLRLIPIIEVVPNPRNNNRHSIEQINYLAKLIKAHGFREPLLISNRSGFLIAGHGRLEAAKLLGMETIPAIFQDFASEAEEYQHMTADNEIARWAELDYQNVYDTLKEIPEIDTELLGIEDFKIESNEVPLPDLDSNDPDCRQVTFILSNEQKDILDEAMEKAKISEDCTDEINQNSNGNVLAAILKRYVHG